ncbi:hypothetical protein EDD17DRAFT_1667529 [Pisolithus thermaeus]|nr:hypothetical protein EDD17DRAFT_1667529 [Pisolithus thermaeus]
MLSAVAARKASARQTDEQSAQSSSHPTSIQASREWSPSRPVELEESDAPRPEPTVISNFLPVLGQNTFLLARDDFSATGFQGDNGVVLVLNASESVALLGVYLLTVLQGRANLCGVTLGPSSTQHRVFAPRSSPIPVISWAPQEGHSKMSQRPLPLSVHANPDTTVVLIRYASTGVEGLGRICRVFENVFKPPRGTTARDIGIPEIRLISHSTKDMLPYTLPPSWETGLTYMDLPPNSRTDITLAPLCMVKGPKKSGKSTFSRTLLNRLLSRYRRVAFLECDVGQSEFTPGGMVALSIIEGHVFGPPFTHPTLPYRAQYIGSSTPRANPSYYLSAIQTLLETYRLEVHVPALADTSTSSDGRIEDVIPLVVNTMGWTKGLGADLNTRIGELVEPSHVFEIEGSEEGGWPARSVDLAGENNHTFPLCSPATSAVRVQLEAIQADATNMHAFSAADHRNINTLSYFHAVFPPFIGEQQPSASVSFSVVPSPVSLRQVTAECWDATLPLCARYPYEVCCESAFDRVYLVGSGYEDVVPSELPRVLNCAVVGLVAYDENTKEAEMEPTDQVVSSLPYSPGQPVPHPSISNCLGLALIRGVFSSSNPSPTPSQSSLTHLHILTPLPPSILGHARVLIKGEFELPVWGMLDFREGEEGGIAGVERERVPYLQWGKSEGLGSQRRRVRRNLMRKAQM